MNHLVRSLLTITLALVCACLVALVCLWSGVPTDTARLLGSASALPIVLMGFSFLAKEPLR